MSILKDMESGEYYEWAIGPHEQRLNNIHGNVGEPTTNDFGPDEFGQLLKKTNAEGLYVVDASGWTGVRGLGAIAS